MKMRNIEKAWKEFVNKEEIQLVKTKKEKKPFLKKRFCIKCDELFETYAKEGKICEQCKNKPRGPKTRK